MFDWCEKVTIYNIENHYYHCDCEEVRLRNYHSGKWRKLQSSPEPINLIQPLPKEKKGISLSHTLPTHESWEGKGRARHSKTVASFFQNDQIPHPSKRKNYCVKTDLSDRQVGNDHSGNTQKLYTKQKTELTHCSNSQTLGKKIKPVVPSLIRSKNSSDTILKMEEEREISPMIETQKCRQIREKFEPGYQIENEESWEEFARATQFIKQSYDWKQEPEYETSENLKLQKFHQNLSKSYLSNVHNNNQILQITEPSIILSQCFSQKSKRKHERLEKKASRMQGWLLEQDRKTIISRSNGDSEEYRVEESYVCEHDSKNNFLFLEGRKVQGEKYNIRLGLQKKINLLVSVKEVGIQEMGSVAAQMQLYEELESTGNFEESDHILELYQTQLSEGSYLLIKQPYTRTLEQVLRSSSPQTRAQQAASAVQTVLTAFSKMHYYPKRPIAPEDIVESNGTFKLHNLSIFTSSPSFSQSELMDRFKASTKQLTF